jgi:hypothetical protein
MTIPEWKPLSALFQRTPLKKWNDVSTLFGDVFYDLDGNQIQRGQKLDESNRARRPAVINNERTVVGDLIPSTSWGASLANLLTKESWDGLRLPLIQKNHCVCELCGKRLNTLDVHEIWDYQFPPEHEWAQRNNSEATVFGVQKLRGLMAICHNCHRCFHLGKANIDGKLGLTRKRLAALNFWPENTLEVYCITLNARHSLASEIFWMLDLSWVNHPDGGISIRKAWKVHPEVSHILTAPSKLGSDNITGLLNVPWKFEDEVDWRTPTSNQDV